VPNSWTRDRKTAVTEPSICSWNSEYIDMSRAKLSASGVRSQWTVIRQVRRSLTSQQAVWKQEWPTFSRPAVSTEANADYKKLTRCGHVDWLLSESVPLRSGLTADAW